MTAPDPVPLRSLGDRIRQAVLFELIGLLVMTPIFAWGSAEPLATSAGLMAAMAALAALWNGIYSTVFDWLEARLAGRRADRRPPLLRAVHAIGFELGLMLATLPLIVVFTHLDWLAALVADLALAAAYAVYAYVFNLGYDRLFPVVAGGAD